MTQVKICGIKEEDHALAAVEAGADFIGFVLAPSKRQVSSARAHEVINAVKRRSNAVKTVGVFVNTPASEVNRIADFCGLDWIQLSGDEFWEYCREIERPIIKVVHVPAGKTAMQIIAEIKKGSQLSLRQELICLLDSQIGTAYGGTGQAFNWQLAKEASTSLPIIIAGGLTPQNVGKLVRNIRPWGVDVSSGIETNGRKDAAKIREFIQTVREAQ